MQGVSEYIQVPQVDLSKRFKASKVELSMGTWEERPITKKRGPRKRKTVRVWTWYNLNDI